MKFKIFMTLAFVVLGTLTSAWANCDATAQDAALERYFQNTDGKLVTWTLRLGTYDVTPDAGIWLTLTKDAKAVDLTQFAFLKALELAGYLKLEVTSKEIHSLSAEDKLLPNPSQSLGTVHVSATTSGEEVTTKYGDPKDDNVFSFRPIVKMERKIEDMNRFASGFDRYIVVNSRFTTALTPEGMKIGNALTSIFRETPSAPACFKVEFTEQKHRGTILLKLDPSNCTWKLIEADWTNSESGPFCSNDVNQAILRLNH